MSRLRFNHMELTLPQGELEARREDIKRFYGEVFQMESLDVPILNQTGLLLRTDPETSQFLLVTEQKVHVSSPGYDHLGFLMETRAEVDDIREKVGKWQERDSRVEIKDYDDLVTGPVTVRAFYVRYLLPIWFDVQVIEYEDGARPTREWRYADVASN